MAKKSATATATISGIESQVAISAASDAGTSIQVNSPSTPAEPKWQATVEQKHLVKLLTLARSLTSQKGVQSKLLVEATAESIFVESFNGSVGVRLAFATPVMGVSGTALVSSSLEEYWKLLPEVPITLQYNSNLTLSTANGTYIVESAPLQGYQRAVFNSPRNRFQIPKAELIAAIRMNSYRKSGEQGMEKLHAIEFKLFFKKKGQNNQDAPKEALLISYSTDARFATVYTTVSQARGYGYPRTPDASFAIPISAADRLVEFLNLLPGDQVIIAIEGALAHFLLEGDNRFSCRVMQEYVKIFENILPDLNAKPDVTIQVAAEPLRNALARQQVGMSKVLVCRFQIKDEMLTLSQSNGTTETIPVTGTGSVEAEVAIEQLLSGLKKFNCEEVAITTVGDAYIIKIPGKRFSVFYCTFANEDEETSTKEDESESNEDGTELE